MKKRLTKEKLFEAAKNGDNKSLVLLLRSFETGIEAMDETEDPAWLIENKPAIEARNEEREYFRQMFVDRMKDIDNDTLMSYWMFFAGSSFNAYFILEELARRREKTPFNGLPAPMVTVMNTLVFIAIKANQDHISMKQLRWEILLQRITFV